MAIAPEFPELSQNLVLVVPVFLPLVVGFRCELPPVEIHRDLAEE